MKWEYIPSTEHHGPHVVTEFGSALLALPEREQYALAYTLFKQADEWATAFADGRIRKRRNGASVRVSIETPQEKAWRLGKKAA